MVRLGLRYDALCRVHFLTDWVHKIPDMPDLPVSYGARTRSTRASTISTRSRFDSLARNLFLKIDSELVEDISEI